MKELLAEYTEVLREYHPAFHAALRPGLSREVVQAGFESLPFRITDDAVALYEWADGINDGGPYRIDMIPISYFMPLDQVLLFRGFEDLYPEPYRDSLPFLNDYADGGFGFGSLDGPCNGRIIHYNIEDTFTIGFDSLPDLIRAAIFGYRNGLADENGEWDICGFYDAVKTLYPHLADEWS